MYMRPDEGKGSYVRYVREEKKLIDFGTSASSCQMPNPSRREEGDPAHHRVWNDVDCSHVRATPSPSIAIHRL